MEIEQKRKKVIRPKEERPSIEKFVELFFETKELYRSLNEITSNRDYQTYVSRRFRYKADLDESQHKVKEIREHFDSERELWDSERELFYLRYLRKYEARLQRLLENPILQNSIFEEYTLQKDNMIVEINTRLERIKTTWGLEIPVYLLQKETPDEVLSEMKERGSIA
jgi:hypothetical protein